MEVMTVLGPIDAETMGFTQPHEHVLLDHFDMKGSYDAIVTDRELAAEEVRRSTTPGAGPSWTRRPSASAAIRKGSPRSRARPGSTS